MTLGVCHLDPLDILVDPSQYFALAFVDGTITLFPFLFVVYQVRPKLGIFVLAIELVDNIVVDVLSLLRLDVLIITSAVLSSDAEYDEPFIGCKAVVDPSWSLGQLVVIFISPGMEVYVWTSMTGYEDTGDIITT